MKVLNSKFDFNSCTESSYSNQDSSDNSSNVDDDYGYSIKDSLDATLPLTQTSRVNNELNKLVKQLQSQVSSLCKSSLNAEKSGNSSLKRDLKDVRKKRDSYFQELRNHGRSSKCDVQLKSKSKPAKYMYRRENY